jgi:hypothetical protein
MAFTLVPVVVVFTKFDALSAVALGELSKKSGLTRSKIFDMIPEHAKKIFTNANIWDRLCGVRYPPKDYVSLAGEWTHQFVGMEFNFSDFSNEQGSC